MERGTRRIKYRKGGRQPLEAKEDLAFHSVAIDYYLMAVFHSDMLMTEMNC